MASKPPSTAGSHKSRRPSVNDQIWKQMLQDNHVELVNGLRKVAVTILKSLHENNVIDDKQFRELKNLKPANITDRILEIIEKKDKQEFLIFRDIIKRNRQLALYKLLDIESAYELAVDDSTQEGDGIGDLRHQVGEANRKIDEVMNVLLRFETKHDHVMKEIREKQQECDKLKKNNSNLNSEINEPRKQLEKCRCGGSGEKVKMLEEALMKKTRNLVKNERANKELEKEVHRLQSELHEMNAANSSDVAKS